jgi:hypothetical protein
MTEEEYYAGDITDAELNAIADAGDFALEEPGFSGRSGHDMQSGGPGSGVGTPHIIGEIGEREGFGFMSDPT